ncbi:MAG: exodeoxyribonuclease I [Hyphomicrobiales bacterium]|nr:MAG: exodeoxyribonuclease I [Hyphomicrobiales bacterium]
MSFILYDIETTGLVKGYDQIVQLAAVRTDASLKIIDHFQTRCRLMPHVIPSPDAIHVTGVGIERLTDPFLPSHFEMMREVHRVFSSWRPALFLGFNSLSFDEEFLRQALYQSLFGAYLTNTQGSARADVLNLCRLTAALKPDILKPGLDAEGRPVFKLKPLAEANGIHVPLSHDAMADVMTMHALCHLIHARAPGIWSQSMRFSNKATVESFITDEDAFLVSETFGNHHRARVVILIGKHSTQPIRNYCLDLGADMDALRAMSEDALIALCRSVNRPIVTVRSNAAPTLWALYNATPEHLAPFDEAEVLQRAAELRDDRVFMQRLRKAAEAAERVYPPSPHVEEQLYERGFPPQQDEQLMQRFHAATWEERADLVARFKDDRYRRLAVREVYFERPDLLGEDQCKSARESLEQRLMAPVGADVRWRSIPVALQEANALIAAGLHGEDLGRQQAYVAYLRQRARDMERDVRPRAMHGRAAAGFHP